MGRYLFTSESVTEGHPDKIADQISDAILDDLLRQDPFSRVGCETIVTTGLVLVAGEIRTKAYCDIPKIVRQTIKEIGYDDATYGFDYKGCSVLTAIDEQSPDIALGVDNGGAGDQGMMFGFACRETPELMPLPIMLAHRMAKRLAEMRKKGILKYLRPDGKTQVTVEYDGFKPLRVDSVVVSTQHSPKVTQKRIKDDIIRHVIEPVCGKWLGRGGGGGGGGGGGAASGRGTIFHINPTGRFIIGGPPGDCGVTGRKLMVDTYGGTGRHGGGCFSGKDPTKVDRSGTYMARYVAKNIVAAGLAERCEVQVAYAIGVAEPVSINVNTFGTGRMAGGRQRGEHDGRRGDGSSGRSDDYDAKLAKLVSQVFDFSPQGIIKHLNLRRPIYKKTAAYGHFGRKGGEFTWERVDMAEKLKKVD